MTLRGFVASRPQIKNIALLVMRLRGPFGRFTFFPLVRAYAQFFSDWRGFRSLGGAARALDFYPCLFDNQPKSSIDAHYFHQAVWAFRKISQARPTRHVDVGSDVNYVGMLTAVVPVTFVDIRPLELTLPNYEGLSGSVLSLPFPDSSIESLSSLHVIEHIGLGRYGDPIDPQGSQKAAREIARVIGPGGRAYITVPIGRPRVQFNGQRVFAVGEVMSMFAGLRLVELSVVEPAGRLVEAVDASKLSIDDSNTGADCGLGLFEFIKDAV